MTKTSPVAEATAAFMRVWGFEPPPKADQSALELLLSAKASKPTRHRRSSIPRPSDGYLSVGEVAAALHVSTDTVIRRFSGLPGVVDLSRPGTRRKRRYRTLRISPATLKQFLKNKR